MQTSWALNGFLCFRKRRKGREEKSPRAAGRCCVKAPPSVGLGMQPAPWRARAAGARRSSCAHRGRLGYTRHLSLRACPRVCTRRGTRPVRSHGRASGERHKEGPGLSRDLVVGSRGRRNGQARSGRVRFTRCRAGAPQHPGERRICAHTRIF